MPTTGLCSLTAPIDPRNRRVAVGEDAAVRRHEPVPVAVGRRRHAHDGGVEVLAPHGPEEAGVAVGEHPAVRRHQPVAVAVGRRRHAHDGGVEVLAPHGARGTGRRRRRTRRRPTPPASTRCPTAVSAMPTTGACERQSPGRAVEAVAEGEHPAVRRPPAGSRDRPRRAPPPGPSSGLTMSDDSSTASKALAGMFFSSSTSACGHAGSAVPPKYQLLPLSARISP